MRSPRRIPHALRFALLLTGLLAAAPARAETAPTESDWLAPLSQLGRELRDLAWQTGTLTVIPVDAEVTSPFGYRRDPINRRRKLHKGLDFDADRGSPVLSAGAGRVITARRKRGYGRVVIIDHGRGVETVYAHLRRIKVRRGDLIPAGTVIGTVGSSGRATGPHLHFEVHRNGKAVDPRRVLPIGGVVRQHGAGS